MRVYIFTSFLGAIFESGGRRVRAARLPGGAGAGGERCPPQSGEGGGGSAGTHTHTQARLLPPQLCRGADGGRGTAILTFFFLGRYAFLWETSVGGRGAAEGGGGGVRRGGAHPEPP